MSISVFIVDDHKVFRQGIKSLIDYEEDIEVIGTAGSIKEFRENILKYDPNVILMDISLKDGEGPEVTKWIKDKKPATVHEGQTFYSYQIMQSIVKQLVDEKPNAKKLAGQKLTKRELQVLKLIADELSNKEIADTLFISTRTVDAHKRNLLEKLQAKNTAGLVKFAIRLGLIEL